MAINQDKIVTYGSLPYIIFFLACCFLGVLLFTIEPGVFFSGDAGLKYLVLRQFSNTGVYKTLDFAKPVWVHQVWSQGFYPFKPPFVYSIASGKMVSFPPAFQWINTLFYKLFGYSGIYIVPCASVVLLWAWFIILLRKVNLPSLVVAAGFFLLAFCSPLTVYGAIYWEHSLAALLLFAGVAYLVQQPSSYYRAFLTGLLAGSAVWLRPEAMVLCALLSLTVLYNYYRNRNAADLVFIFAEAIAVLGFFCFNNLEYGNILGAHSIQVLDQGGGSKLKEGLIHLTHINARLFVFFPAAVLFYALAVYLFIKKRPLMPVVVYQLTVIIVVFSLLTPFILPNAGGKQWGPRYFILLVPIMLTTLCLAVMHIPLTGFPLRRWRFLILLFVAYGLYLNVYKAAKTLRDDYAYRVSPGLRFLGKDSCNVLVVQNQYIAQEFATIFERKHVFLAETDTTFDQLQNKLRSVGITEILYMASSNENKSLANKFKNGGRDLLQVGDYFFGKYELR